MDIFALSQIAEFIDTNCNACDHSFHYHEYEFMTLCLKMIGFVLLNRQLAFSVYAVERSPRNVDDSNVYSRELETFASGQTRGSLSSSNDIASSSGYRLTHVESSTSSDGSSSTTSTSAGESSSLINGRAGVSLFQGYNYSLAKISVLLD